MKTTTLEMAQASTAGVCRKLRAENQMLRDKLAKAEGLIEQTHTAAIGLIEHAKQTNGGEALLYWDRNRPSSVAIRGMK